MSTPQRTHENNKSSLFQKLTPDQRKALDVAIIERLPPTFQAVWMEHNLGALGVSYTAFYRYARRLRDRANVAEIADLAGDTDSSLDEPIRKLVARRLVELLLHTDDVECLREIATLLSAHRQAARTALHHDRHADSSRLAWARLDHDRERLRLLADPSRPQRLLRLTNESKHAPAANPSPSSDLESDARRLIGNAERFKC